MAAIYVNLILKGRKTFSEVPANLKELVKEVLLQTGHEELTRD